MMGGLTGWLRVNRNTPCAICAKPDWCLISENGSAAICPRVKSERRMGDAGWLHRFESSNIQFLPTPPEESATEAYGEHHWAVRADEFFESPFSATARERLASEWRVRTAVIEALMIGWDGKTYSIPECDADGNIIGISRRWPDGRKRFHSGGNRGLTYAADWYEDDGSIYVVEGASDVAAMLQADYCVIGRPSSSGGLKHLEKMLMRVDREVIILGENDKRPDGTWPGLAAKDLAKRLCWKLHRKVKWGLPNDAKDMREQLSKKGSHYER